MQNQVIIGTDTPVVFGFTFTGEFGALGLNNFTNIELSIGDESYATDLTPDNVWVASPTELRMNIGTVTTLRPSSYYVKIVGFSAVYDDGYVMVGCARNKLQVRVISCPM